MLKEKKNDDEKCLKPQTRKSYLSNNTAAKTLSAFILTSNAVSRLLS